METHGEPKQIRAGPWRFHGDGTVTPSVSMETLEELHGCLWISIETPWVTVDLDRDSMISMDTHVETPGVTMEIGGAPRSLHGVLQQALSISSVDTPCN